jgi:hypothetical protein
MTKKEKGKSPCPHTGQPVKVGSFTIYAAGSLRLTPRILSRFQVLIPLTDRMPDLGLGNLHVMLSAQLPDFGGVPDNWGQFILRQVIPLLEECAQSDARVLCFCTGGHGRTGTLLASLIAVLESAKETPDPIAAVRQRHCHHAVETYAQAEGIFALRGQGVPEIYDDLL